jgi:hypothetical protein
MRWSERGLNRYPAFSRGLWVPMAVNRKTVLEDGGAFSVLAEGGFGLVD